MRDGLLWAYSYIFRALGGAPALRLVPCDLNARCTRDLVTFRTRLRFEQVTMALQSTFKRSLAHLRRMRGREDLY